MPEVVGASKSLKRSKRRTRYRRLHGQWRSGNIGPLRDEAEAEIERLVSSEVNAATSRIRRQRDQARGERDQLRQQLDEARKWIDALGEERDLARDQRDRARQLNLQNLRGRIRNFSAYLGAKQHPPHSIN